MQLLRWNFLARRVCDSATGNAPASLRVTCCACLPRPLPCSIPDNSPQLVRIADGLIGSRSIGVRQVGTHSRRRFGNSQQWHQVAVSSTQQWRRTTRHSHRGALLRLRKPSAVPHSTCQLICASLISHNQPVPLHALSGGAHAACGHRADRCGRAAYRSGASVCIPGGWQGCTAAAICWRPRLWSMHPVGCWFARTTRRTPAFALPYLNRCSPCRARCGGAARCWSFASRGTVPSC